MNLRDLTEDQKGILFLVENGDLTDAEVFAHLSMIQEEREKKIESILHVINDYDNDIHAISREISRLSNILKSKKAKQKHLNYWLMINLDEGEEFEFESGIFGVKKLKKAKSVIVKDASKIPDEYMRVTKEANKTEIKAAIQRGEEVPGCVYDSDGYRLSIK